MTTALQAAYRDLPKKLIVAGHEISLRTYNGKESAIIDAEGYFEKEKQEIGVYDDLPSASRVAEILIHEVTHAFYWAYAIDEDEVGEEETTGILAAAWIALYRSNPNFIPWLLMVMR